MQKEVLCIMEDNKILCRICLEYTTDYLELFNKSKESVTLLENIYLCFQISLSLRIDLPHKICKDCMNELEAANNFRIKCITFNDRYSTVFKDKINEEKKIKLEYNENSIPDNDFSANHNLCDIGPSEIKHPDSDTLGNFECYHCGKTLKTKASLLKHIVSMHQRRKHIGKVAGFGATRLYHCTNCTYSTPHSQTLVNHMRRHDGKRPYNCHCGKRFTQSAGLTAHLKTHSETTYYTCSKCGKQFKHAYSLKRHLTVHQNGSFICNMCHKVLKSKQSLQEHIQRHYNIRNYSCEGCGNTFVTSSELIHHKSKHKDDKRLECHLCGYKTHEKKSLILHLKRHAGNKNIKCNFCEVTFYTRGECQRHQRVHTREKPFTCPTCSQRFGYSPSLNKHMLIVHGVQYKWAEVRSKNKKIAGQH